MLRVLWLGLLALGLWPTLASAQVPSFTTEGTPRGAYRLGYSSTYGVMSQTFTATQSTLGRVDVSLAQVGATPGPLRLIVRNSAGTSLGQTVVSPGPLSTVWQQPTRVPFIFSPVIPLVIGSVYTLRLEATVINTTHHYFWPFDTLNPYAGGAWSLGTKVFWNYDGLLRGFAGTGGPPARAGCPSVPALLTPRPGTSSASTAPTARTTTAKGSAATTPSEKACGLA